MEPDATMDGIKDKGKIKDALLHINHRHWYKVKKEMTATTYGTFIYHIWRARNQKFFTQ